MREINYGGVMSVGFEANGYYRSILDNKLWPWCRKGTNEMRLTISRGGEDWFYMTVADGDHLSTRSDKAQRPYYRDRLRKLQTALYTQKHNRYVSLTARGHEILITKPFVLDGDTLFLNADASRGEIRIGVAPAEPAYTFGGSVPADAPHMAVYSNNTEKTNLPQGFKFSDCAPVTGNGIELKVSFRESLGKLRGRPVRLYFSAYDADLYGFKII